MRTLFLTLTFSLLAVAMNASAYTPSASEGQKCKTYKVEKGDTYYSIAIHFGVTVEQLRAANDTADESLQVGQKIQIPVTSKLKKHSHSEQEVAAAAEDTAAAEAQVKSEKVKKEKADEEEKIEKAPKAAKVEEGVIEVKLLDSLALPCNALVERIIALLEPLVANEQLQPANVDVPFRALQQGERAEVVLMLPLGSEEQPAAHYIEFYRGFALGLDSLRTMGVSANINVFNTARDSVRVANVIASGILDKAHLVIGPVYEEELAPVATSLIGKGIPVVSPLATLKDVKSHAVFQMAPSQESRMDKVRALVEQRKRLVIISTNHNDAKFEKAVRAMATEGIELIEKQYVTEHPASLVCRSADLLPLLKGGQSVVVVTSTNEIEVMRILSALRAAKGALRSRANNGQPFTLIGHNSWNKFTTMEKADLYKSEVNMITNYFSNYAHPTIKEFEKRYVDAYGVFPTPYSYRGHDAAVVFIKALYNEKMSEGLDGEHFLPLCTPYLFKKNEESGIRVNSEWVLIKYNADYTLTLE